MKEKEIQVTVEVPEDYVPDDYTKNVILENLTYRLRNYIMENLDNLPINLSRDEKGFHLSVRLIDKDD